GNIYVAGSYVPSTKRGTSAFVAKLASGGAQVIYFKSLGGSFNDLATALTIAPDGSAYLAGNTNSYDFPVAGGGATLTGNVSEGLGFLAKLDAAGNLVYSGYIQGQAGTAITGIALDASGNVYLAGSGGPGAPANPEAPLQGFVLEMNAA